MDALGNDLLAGRRYLVVGVGDGMGRHSARALHRAGAEIACVDLDPEVAKRAAAEVNGLALTGDVTDRGEVERIVAESERELGPVNGLVDIVGLGVVRPFMDLTDDLLDQQFKVNTLQAVMLMQTVARALGDRGGEMVFISSILNQVAAPIQSAYGAAKAALASFVRSAAFELSPQHIRLNAVSPGIILTPRVQGMFSPAAVDHFSTQTPLGRLGTPDDIAGAVLFLISPLASYITGQTLVVDGGVSVKFGYSFDV
jgi:NAD(P)-dependent dehydrogenase (short-subunit alcohol dehydrogenase family)